EVAESEPNNNIFDQGTQTFTLPFVVTGTVSAAVDGDADEDYYNFVAEPGQALRVRLATTGAEFWGAMILFGIDFENNTVVRVLVNEGFADTQERELFITQPGEYTVLVSDLRNLVVTPENVGGDTFNYTLTISTFEPEVREVDEVPFSDRAQFNERLNIWSFPTDGIAAVEINASGNSFDPNAILLPAIALFDPESNTTLVETGDAELEDQDVSARSLTTDSERLWFILDPIQGFGPGATDVQLRGLPTEEESEPNANQDTASPTVAPGSITGRIDTPTADPNLNRLIADVDFYVFRATSGQLFEIAVTGTDENSALDAYIEVGQLSQFGGFSTITLNNNAGPDTLDAALTWMAPGDGFYYVRVQDQTNRSIGPDEDPVGGLRYAYQLSLTETTYTPVETIAPTAVADGMFTEPGALLFYTVDLSESAGPVEISTTGVGGASTYVSVWNAETLEFLGSERFGALGVLTEAEQLLVAVGEFQNRSEEGMGYQLSVRTQDIEVAEMLPYAFEGSLAATGERDLYRISVEAGQLLDIRVDYSDSDIILPEIALYDAGDLSSPFRNTFSSFLLVQFDAPQDVIVEISDLGGGGGANYGYTFSVREVVPETFDTLPLQIGGPIEEPGAAYFATIPYEEGLQLVGELSSTGDAVVPQVWIYNAETLGQLRSFTELEFVWS
ncbi:MAG: hypothetical protein AAFX99_32510, partial [Myxococcota bacterium]